MGRVTFGAGIGRITQERRTLGQAKPIRCTGQIGSARRQSDEAPIRKAHGDQDNSFGGRTPKISDFGLLPLAAIVASIFERDSSARDFFHQFPEQLLAPRLRAVWNANTQEGMMRFK